MSAEEPFAPEAQEEAPPPGTIPLSVLVQLYRLLRAMSQYERLRLAHWLIKEPKILDNWFMRSVRRYARHFEPNPGESFRPLRDPLESASSIREITSGRDLAVKVADLPQCRLWEVPDSRDLALVYIDHEVPPTRKTGAAKFEDGTPSTKGMKADLLLAAADGTPIVAEVKVATETHHDTDPVLALLQALTLASQLATPSQLSRLVTHYGEAGISSSELVDVAVIVFKPEIESKAKHQAKLYSAAQQLGALIQEQDHIRKSVGRITFIEARLTAGELSLSVPEASS